MQMSTLFPLGVVLTALFSAESVLAAVGSCRALGRCCDGKNTTCVAHGNSHNYYHRSARSVKDKDSEDDYSEEDDYSDAAYEEEQRLWRAEGEPCYCDHGCLDVGDCCLDYKEFCGVLDCVVGEWSEWSSCDVSCGTGTSVRRRDVVQESANGGAQCPHTQEKRTCTASKCSKGELDRFSAFGETAMLLPGKYAKAHKSGNKKKYDVRSNLRSYRSKESKGYCVVFHVDKSTKYCLNGEDTSELFRGNLVCALCDDKAQRDALGGRCSGHGTEGKTTKFKSILDPHCHGRWTRLELAQDECPCSRGPTFIFV